MTAKPFGVAKIRDFAAARVADSSLRAVSDEIGISWSGLRKFLGGADPHPGTAAKLSAWYAVAKNAPAPRAGQTDRSERADVDAAIERIRSYLRGGGSSRVARERERRVRALLFGEAEQ